MRQQADAARRREQAEGRVGGQFVVRDHRRQRGVDIGLQTGEPGHFFDEARDGRRGLPIVARDGGPGIPDVAQAMKYGYSTRRGIGMGLPGAKWLMDEFDIVSAVGHGTTVTMTKWLPHDPAHSHAA